MRDITRARMAAVVKSRRASARELNEARARIKEIDNELRQIELQPETRQGEEREARYERVLRLRQMRDEFESRYPVRGPRQPNSLILALVMTIGSFLTCAFFAGGFYFAYNALTFNPGPVATADTFWTDVQSQGYQDIYLNVLGTNLRLQYAQPQFLNDAKQADTDYGDVTNVTLVSQPTNPQTTATLTYKVTRVKGGKTTSYTTKLTLTATNGSWSISDMGAAIYPTEGGAPAINSATPAATTPSATTTPGQ